MLQKDTVSVSKLALIKLIMKDEKMCAGVNKTV